MNGGLDKHQDSRPRWVNSLVLDDIFTECLHPVAFVSVRRFIRVIHVDDKLPHGEFVHE